MPTFDTPRPITAHVEAAAGSVRLVASERTDTVVEVRPFHESRPADVKAAEQARVDFDNGTLRVAAHRRGLSWGRSGAVDIEIHLPACSRLRASSASADVRADGVFTDCRLSSASGDLVVGTVTGKVKADTASGTITVANVEGNVSISTASGGADIGELDGNLKFQAASGGLTIERLRGAVNAQTASGEVSVATAVTGVISVQTSSGDVEVGIFGGTAARLDLTTGSGVVTNQLEPSDGPADGDDTLIVHVRTGSGDVDIHRSASTVVG
jgi:DUF4097 and DUF4098 domain-containing protein YvlB